MLHLRKIVDSNEEEYRGYYCKTEVAQSRLAMLLFAVPIAGFIFNDYMFFGLSLEFFGIAALRAVLLLVITLEFQIYEKRFERPRS